MTGLPAISRRSEPTPVWFPQILEGGRASTEEMAAKQIGESHTEEPVDPPTPA